jgi:mono/diheme cytochrome c family protein
MLATDPSPDVRIQLALSLRSHKTDQTQTIVKTLLADNPDNELMQFSFATFAESQKVQEAERARTRNLSPADRALVTNGATIFKQLCATCHGPDGKGIVIGGGQMPAPPLVGSPRVTGDKILVTQLLLNGMRGPVDGKTYPDMMPSMGGNNDTWIASVLSYIRNSSELGNKSSVVTPAEVAEVRANTPKMPGMTQQELEIFKLGRAERTNWSRPDEKNKSE